MTLNFVPSINTTLATFMVRVAPTNCSEYNHVGEYCKRINSGFITVVKAHKNDNPLRSVMF